MVQPMSGNPFSAGADAAMIGRILVPLALTIITLTQAVAAAPDEQRGKTVSLTIVRDVTPSIE